MPEIVLIRGVPGSGKTTKAKTEYSNHILCEADQFFTHPGTGDYKFDPEKLYEAHEFCMEKARACLEAGHNVVVANTFTRVWEMQLYFDMGYPIRVVEATGNYGSVHGVPPETVARMRERFEAYSC